MKTALVRRILTALAVVGLSAAAVPAATHGATHASVPDAAPRAERSHHEHPLPEGRPVPHDRQRPVSGEAAIDPGAEEDDRSDHVVPLAPDADPGRNASPHPGASPGTVRLSRTVPASADRVRIAASLYSAPRTGPPFRR